MKKRFWLVMALLVALLLVVSACAQPEDKDTDTPGEEQIEQGNQDQKITDEAKNGTEEENKEEAVAQMIKDNAPEGCSSCHSQTDDADRRLSAAVKGIEGHPELKEDATVNDCMSVCHASGERGFNKVMHRVHLVEGERYIEKYDHNCINCHQISDEGVVTVKGLQQQQQ